MRLNKLGILLISLPFLAQRPYVSHCFHACFLLLSGCCSLGSSGERNWACECSLGENYEAAGEGWENVEEGFSKGSEPTLHEGVKACEVKNKLGSHPERKKVKAKPGGSIPGAH